MEPLSHVTKFCLNLKITRRKFCFKTKQTNFSFL